MYVLDEKTGRRRFLKIAGGSAAAGALAGIGAVVRPTFGSRERSLPINSDGKRQWGREAGEWIPSCCNMCGGQSGILCHVVNGVVTKIEPNHWNPINYSNVSSDFFSGYTDEYGCSEGGAICAKGNAGIMQLYDPDRVKRPLKRSNARKGRDEDPGWHEISWTQAIEEISGRLRALRGKNEAHKLLWWSEDHAFTHIQNDFCKLFGTPNYSNHSNLCDASRKASFRMAMGEERPLADFIQSRYILLFGWNPTSAIKWVYLPRILTRALERGARLVVVDPYLSDTAVKAHEWIAIRPGTDGALALAMAHVIIREGLYDREFVEKWTVGFDVFSEHVRDKTPGWAEQITGVPARTIERVAGEFAATRPACVDVWSGPGHHSNGVQGGRAIALLAALVGGYDRPGTLMMADNRGNKHVEIEPDQMAARTLKQPRFDGLGDFPFGHKSGVYGRCWERLLAGTGPYEPKMGICVFQNLVMSGPGSSKIEEALKKLETLVVVDTMMSETALLADYLIPGTVYLERYDLNTHWVTWPAVGLRQPVVKAPSRQSEPYPYQGGIFGQMAEYEFVAALGRKLGLKTADGTEFFLVGPFSRENIEDLTLWYEDYLSNELKSGAPKITLAELKELPGAVWVDRGGTRYEKFAEVIPEEKLKTAFLEGDLAQEGSVIWDKPKEKGGKRIGTVIGGKPVRGFFTKSGKIEFYSPHLAWLKDAKGRPVDPLPDYTPCEWQPDADYPLYLINWKEASHTHTRSQNNAWLLEIKATNMLILHPDTAARYSIADGDEVWVESRYGKTKATASLSKRIHPLVVGAQHGFGHWRLGRLAAGRGSGFGDLNTIAYDPLCGQALHKEICVKVYRA